MRTLFYECFSGISGDMNLGAMIDLGVKKDLLISELQKLDLDGWELYAETDQRHGISGTKVTVKITKTEEKHRHLSDIKTIIHSSTLNSQTKQLAEKIFIRIAEAEAKVHNIPIGKVHFHEVGALDSIIDIVGAAICFINLRLEQVIVSPLELGSGFVNCAHGTLPVPAPATAEILKNIPVTKGRVDFEATTPTGAAIIATLGTQFISDPGLKIEKTGYGIGHKENPSLPNMLRVYIGELQDDASAGHSAVLIESNIDDMSPEMYDNLMEKLFASGADDVYLTSIHMKKNRPGIKLSVICTNEKLGPVRHILFHESTTLGIRVFPFQKHTLRRDFRETETPYGMLTVKYSYYGKELVSAKPEIDDCTAIAKKLGLPLKEVYKVIQNSISANEG